MTKEEFHSILQTPDDKCDWWQIHLKERWRQGNMKAVFEITGLDFSDLCEKPIGATSMNKPKPMSHMDPPDTTDGYTAHHEFILGCKNVKTFPLLRRNLNGTKQDA